MRAVLFLIAFLAALLFTYSLSTTAAGLITSPQCAKQTQTVTVEMCMP